MDGKRGAPIAANADQSVEWGVGGDVPALVPKVSTRNGGSAAGTQAGRVTPWFLVLSFPSPPHRARSAPLPGRARGRRRSLPPVEVEIGRPLFHRSWRGHQQLTLGRIQVLASFEPTGNPCRPPWFLVLSFQPDTYMQIDEIE